MKWSVTGLLDRLMRRPRPQAALAWLGRWIEPHVPARHSITLMNTTLQSDPSALAPIIQINEPNGGRGVIR
jgi:hypothetical protein